MPTLPATNLTGHWDASDISTLFTTFVNGGPHTGTPVDGNSVEVFKSLANSSHIYRASAGQFPIYRATTPLMPLPCLDFSAASAQQMHTCDNSNVDLAASDFFNPHARTILISFYPESVLSTSHYRGGSNIDELIGHSDYSGVGVARRYTNSDIYGVGAWNYDGSTSFAPWQGNSEDFLAHAHVLMVRHDASSLYLSLDGGPEGSVPTGDCALLIHRLGLASGYFASPTFDGRIGEVALYNAALTGTNKSDALAYFIDKWIPSSTVAVRVTQVAVEVLSANIPEPPPVTDPAPGGGDEIIRGDGDDTYYLDPGSGVATGRAGILSWMEWYRTDLDVPNYQGNNVDASTYTVRKNLYADQPMNCPTAFYGGRKEPRVETFGRFERLLSEGRTGNWRASTGRIRLSDFDRTIRSRADDPVTRWWTTSVIAVRMVSRFIRASLGQPLTVFVGQLRDASPDPPLSYELELEDYVASLLSNPGFKIPQRVADASHFGFDLVDAAQQHPAPIIYGSHIRAGGAFKPIYLGNDGTDHVWMLAGHACFDCPGQFVDGVLDAGWSVSLSEDFNGYRYAVLRRAVGNAIADACADGTSELTVDIAGVETNGDSTGDLITQVRLQYMHFFVNYIGYRKGYITGAWQANPVWPLIDLNVPFVDVQSFVDANWRAFIRMPAGYPGKGIIGATKSDQLQARDWIARWNLSTDLRQGIRRYGQIFVRDSIPTSDELAASEIFTDRKDIIKGTFKVETKWKEQALRIPYRCDKNYVTGEFMVQDRDAENNELIFYYSGNQQGDKELIGDVREYHFIGDSDVAKNIAEYEIARVQHPPRYPSFETPIGRLTNKELGDYIRVKHFAGVGPDEYRLLYIERHAIEPGKRRTAVTTFDVTDLVDFMVVP